MAVELHFQVSMFGKTGISQGPLDGIPWNFKQASLEFRAGTNEMLKSFFKHLADFKWMRQTYHIMLRESRGGLTKTFWFN